MQLKHLIFLALVAFGIYFLWKKMS